jgi:hypothetical protein
MASQNLRNSIIDILKQYLVQEANGTEGFEAFADELCAAQARMEALHPMSKSAQLGLLPIEEEREDGQSSVRIPETRS